MNPLATNLVLVEFPEFRENTVVHEEDSDTSDSGKKDSEHEIVECCSWAVKMVNLLHGRKRS